MSRLVDEIESRSHWEVTIRPVLYRADRVQNLPAVPELLRKISVELRGWDFPHVDFKLAPIFGNGWVEQGIDWQDIKEIWRITSSGQFRYLGGNRFDWGASVQSAVREKKQDYAGTVGMGETIYRMTEFCEFAYRYSTLFTRPDEVGLRIAFHGFDGYRLIVDDHSKIGSPVERISRSDESSRFDSVVTPDMSGERVREMARRAASDLFQRFGFHMSEALLSEWQSQIVR